MNENFFLPQIYQVLATAIEIIHADRGNIQLYDKKDNALKIVAHIGFNDEFLKLFGSVPLGEYCCGRAFEKSQRVIVEDIFTHESFSHVSPQLKTFGYKSVQSSPLYDDKGKVYGILSTHFTKRHQPSDEEFRILDNYLKTAAPILARKVKQHKIKKSRVRTYLTSQKA